MRLSTVAKIGTVAVLALSAAAIHGSWNAHAQAGINAPGTPPLGFDMWCQEIELLPPARCDERRTTDVKSYEQYRSTVERFQQERDARARREKEFTDRLQRDPTATGRTQAGSPR